ncbi:MAG: hypothetical protein ACI88A_002617, partial [Paraglaciecola sp.]
MLNAKNGEINQTQRPVFKHGLLRLINIVSGPDRFSSW